jgi:hypothetical protein
MMSGFTDEQVHQWLYDISSKGLWISLHYESPGIGSLDRGEINGGGYVRQKVDFSYPVSRAIWSMDDAKFTGLPQSRLKYFGVWSARNRGCLRAYGELPREAVVLEGRGYVIKEGTIALSLG